MIYVQIWKCYFLPIISESSLKTSPLQWNIQEKGIKGISLCKTDSNGRKVKGNTSTSGASLGVANLSYLPSPSLPSSFPQ